MNINDILDHVFLREIGVPYDETIFSDHDKLFKQAIREIVKETLRMAAEDARMNFHDGQFKEDKPLTYFQLGVNNLQIDKDSITNVINKIKL